MRTILLFCFLSFNLFSQNPDSIWVKNNYTKQVSMIPMRDGKKLYTAIYLPKDNSTKHPILMMRTPYSVGPYNATDINPRLYYPHWMKYLRKGYIMVMQDVRGRYMSEGEYADVCPYNENKKGKETDEASDSYDAIDWLVKNLPNNNGNVGVFGISYPGFYSTMAALSGHPALKAVSPQAPVTEWFLGDDFHHNGAFALMDGFGFYYGFGVPRPKPVPDYGRSFKFPGKDNYDFYLKTGALKNFTKLMGDSIKFWNEMFEHPNYDEWWKARNARRGCVNVKPAMLVVGGTFDAEDCYGAWNLYKAVEKQSPTTNNKLVMGPWVHGGWHKWPGNHLGSVRFGDNHSEYYQDNMEIPFFDFYLNGKGKENLLAEASVFFTGEDKWKYLARWPPANIDYTKFYLDKEQNMSMQTPTNTSSFTEYTSDPKKPVPYTEDVHLRRTAEYMCDDQRFAARRTDVLVFETSPLQKEITLAGPVLADLKVSLSTTDADFVVKVIDVFPDDFVYDDKYCCKDEKLKENEMAGYQMLVRGEIMRGRFRNSFEKPEAFSPGKVETVKFELPDVAHTFKKGHKIMIQIQSSWFPLFDRNPQQFVNIYKCDDKDFVPCDIKIFHQADAASYIQLPVMRQ